MKNFLERQQNLIVYMPTCLRENRQLTWQEANETRVVTKSRWVIESVFGHIKRRYRNLGGVTFNKSLEHTVFDFKIACALNNKFGTRLFSDVQHEQFIIDQMRISANKPNNLGFFVQGENMDRRIANNFRPYSPSEIIMEFCQMSFHDLYSISLGTYQIKMSSSYYFNARHRRGLEILVCRQMLRYEHYNIIVNEPILVRFSLQSRHSSRNKYSSFILLSKENNSHKIIEWYCFCKSGARTMGCCSHVMTCIWYLGWGRHNDEILNDPARNLDEIFNRLTST